MPSQDEPASDKLRQMLDAAIFAARQGQRESAREQLLDLLELDEQNEQIWLWLSGVVDDEDDKRLCLENVLTLNPNHEAARKGLLILDGQRPPRKRVRKTYAAVSPATAVLYPERLTREWTWEEPELLAPAVPQPAFQAESTFNDIWSKDQELCAFCAASLQTLADERRCPGCGRSLLFSYYRYPKPSTNMHAYWVVLVGLGQLFLIQLFIDLILSGSIRLLAVDLAAMSAAFVLAAGIYFRHFWAYLISIVFLLLVAAIIGMNLVFGGAVVNALAGGQAITMGEMALLTDTSRTILGQSLALFQPFQLLTAVTGLVIAIFFIAADFERVLARHTAQVDRGLREAGAYFAVGKAYAQQGMWAKAVRHYQRALANDPLKASYAKALGEAYLTLGFRERARDALQTAHRLAIHPPLQVEIAGLLAKLE